MKNKVYVAGSIKNNIRNIKFVMDALRFQGFQIVYDWTLPNNSKPTDIINQELKSVEVCDYFVLVLPGGRGAHIELGAAFAFNKKIILLAENQEQLKEVLAYQHNSIRVVYSLFELQKISR